MRYLDVAVDLSNKRIALILSGSIAAYRSPDLVRDLRREGAEVQVFATADALRYVAQETLEWTSLNPVLTESSPNAEHFVDNSPFSAYLVAPATYNLLNKFAWHCRRPTHSTACLCPQVALSMR